MLRFIWISCASLILTIPVLAQEGLYYYGPNTKTVQTEQEAIMFLKVEKKSKNKYLINTYKKGGDTWVKTMKKKIKLKDDLNQRIIYNTNTLFPRKIFREMKQLGQGSTTLANQKKAPSSVKELPQAFYLSIWMDR